MQNSAIEIPGIENILYYPPGPSNCLPPVPVTLDWLRDLARQAIAQQAIVYWHADPCLGHLRGGLQWIDKGCASRYPGGPALGKYLGALAAKTTALPSGNWLGAIRLGVALGLETMEDSHARSEAILDWVPSWLPRARLA